MRLSKLFVDWTKGHKFPNLTSCSFCLILVSLWCLQIMNFFFKDFIYLFDRDRDSQREREHKQGEWERKKQAHSGGAWCGARSQNAGITPWAKGRRLTAVPPRRPNSVHFLTCPPTFYMTVVRRKKATGIMTNPQRYGNHVLPDSSFNENMSALMCAPVSLCPPHAPYCGKETQTNANRCTSNSITTP